MKLFICGNGLDRSLGFRSSYDDYKYFLKNDICNKNIDAIKTLETSRYFKLANLIEENGSWSRLEEGLSFDYKLYISDYVDLFNQERNKTGIPLSNKQLERINDFSSQDFTQFVKEFRNRKFLFWIASMYFDAVESIKDNYRGYLFEIIQKGNSFLTFNYTPTLEDVFGVNREDVLYIHNRFPQSLNDGKLTKIDFFNDKEAQLEFETKYFQFGSADNDMKGINKYLESLKIVPNNREFSIEDLKLKIISTCVASSKDILSNFNKVEIFLANKDITEVVILGHSFMSIDFLYYEKILVPKLGNVKWNIYCHNVDDYDNANTFKELFVLNLQTKGW